MTSEYAGMLNNNFKGFYFKYLKFMNTKTVKN